MYIPATLLFFIILCVSYGSIHSLFHSHSLQMASYRSIPTRFSLLIRAMPTGKSAFPWSKYPTVRRDAKIVEPLHGQMVPDPYRWLENPDSDETKEFVVAQSKVTDTYFDQYLPLNNFKDKITAMYNYERVSVPSKKGDYYYSAYNPGLLNQSLIVRQVSLADSKPETFFDPNILSENGTVALSTTSFSENGTYFGYALSNAGSDWVTIRVKLAKDMSDLPDVIEFAKFTGINWTIDEKGFFYKRYPKIDKLDIADPGTETDANLFAKVYYHTLGTPQSQDILIWEDNEHPKYSGSVFESDCGHYLVLTISDSTDPKNKLWISRNSKDFRTGAPIEWIKVEDRIDHAGYYYLTNEGTVFYLSTNLDAPLERVVKYDLDNPSLGFVEVIGQDPRGATLKSVKVVDNNKAIIVYSVDVQDVVYLYNLFTGERLKEYKLPTIASVSAISGRRIFTEAFFSYSGFTSPCTVMRLDVQSGELSEFKKSAVPGFNSDEFEATQKFYNSKDGTRVPMFIIHKKGIKLDGSNPTKLYGYGGFSISIGPSFSIGHAAFMKHYGGVVAIPNIRGGGEYGEDWHLAGVLGKKQNVFDDFQWAAKYLISQGYTSANKLAINGGSNGGLLIGACINQAPELFAAAVADVGVLDMLRFHKFTIGHAWMGEYGDPDVKEDFENLIAYSPLHNIKKQAYPATMLMTSDHDDRVVPLHSYKYISELQYQNPDNSNPLLIHIERDAGHGAGKPLSKTIATAAQQYAFIAMNTGALWQD